MMNKKTSHGTFKQLDKENLGEEQTKVILLSGFSDKQVNEVIDHYRTNTNLPQTIFAVVTLKSKLMRLHELLKELKREQQAMKEKK
ncbi:DUF3783 domain-containing protein [Candidatus Woesearchaeota archaeon]|nr:DUF3783 domain-containing protein [Candidatus Woesearchaeota archaeon]